MNYKINIANYHAISELPKFDLVIDSSTLVLYRNSSIDLTDKVIQRYDSLKK